MSGQALAICFVPVKDMRLLEVKLGELPTWLATRNYSPISLTCLGTGIGGLAILLTGYVVVSYIWEYDRLKHERWRKYH
uniref:Uncharacterized protein n=1 Tax=Sphenodon punctatus TaxID=8508 RepID=A0A8D0GDI9_SPHPU